MSNSVQDWLEALEDIDDATREEAAKALADFLRLRLQAGIDDGDDGLHC